MAGADEPKTTGQSDNKPKVNVLLGGKIKLFNRELAAVYEKEGDNSHSFILIPTKMDTDTEGITFDEMTEDIDKLFKDSNNPNSGADMSQLTALGETITDKNKARFHLTMAYLYFEFSGEERKTVQFAIQVKVTNISLIPQNNFFNIEEAQLAIWSTDNQKVIDAMHLISPQDYKPKQK